MEKMKSNFDLPAFNNTKVFFNEEKHEKKPFQSWKEASALHSSSGLLGAAGSNKIDNS